MKNITTNRGNCSECVIFMLESYGIYRVTVFTEQESDGILNAMVYFEQTFQINECTEECLSNTTNVKEIVTSNVTTIVDDSLSKLCIYSY